MGKYINSLVNARMKAALERDYVAKIIRQTEESKGLLTCLTQSKDAIEFYDAKIKLLRDCPNGCMDCEYAKSVELNDSCMPCIEICQEMNEEQ